MKCSTVWALLALACLLPRGNNAFSTIARQPLATLSALRMVNDDIESLQKETDEALRAAKKAIEDVDQRMAQAELKRKQQAAAAAQAEQLSDAIASGISAAAIGAVLGTIALIEFPDLAVGDPLVPPLVTSVLLAGAAFATANSDTPASPVVRNALGKGLKGLGKSASDSVKNAVDNAIASVVAIPGKLVDAAEKKAKETAEEIAAIPGKLVDAAEQKAKETADEIAAIPGKLADAAEKKVKDTIDEIEQIPGKITQAAEQKVKETVLEAEQKIKETVEEIESIPIKLTQAAEQKIKETTQEIKELPTKLQEATKAKVKETTEEMKELPTKLQEATIAKVKEVSEDLKQDIQQIEATIEQKAQEVVEEVKALPQEIKEEIQRDVANFMPPPKLPEPPKMPPPPKPPMVERPPEPKIEMPKIEMPKLEAPKIELPKISLPKAELPKIPTPPKIPAPPKKAPPKKKEEDSFVFNEVSLKQLVQKAPKAETKDDLAEKRRQLEAQEAKALDAKRKADAEKRAQEAKDKAEAVMEANRKADEERKAAADKERIAQARAAAEAKKKAAEVKRAEEERKEQERQEREERLRLEREEKRAALIRAKKAQDSVETAKPRSTFSLTSLFRSSDEEDATEPKAAAAPSTPSALTKKSAAPPGVPTISGWKQNPDGSITGRISGGSGFKENEKIETSPIRGKAVGGNVVQTASGSRYFLAGKEASGGFSLFDAPAKPAAPKPAVAKSTVSKEVSGGFGLFGTPSKPAVAKKPAVAARDTKAAEERKAAAARAAEKQRREAEAKRAAIAEEKRQKAEEAKASAAAAAEARRVAAEQERQEAEAKRAAAAEEKRRQAEVNRRKADEAKAASAAEAKRKEAEQKKAAAVRAKQAQESVKQAKPRSTFSLTTLFGGSEDAGAKAETAKPAVQPQTASVAPRGVPTISEWKQNRDGSISGRISGGVGFKDGEKIETSPIRGKAIGGAIVQTTSGSRYYLAAKAASGGFGMFGSPKPAAPDTKAGDDRKAAEARAAEQKRQEAEATRAAAAKEKRRKAEEAKMAEARRVAEAKRAEAAVAAEEKRKQAAAAATAEAKRKEAEAKKVAAARAKQAQAAQQSAKRGATISLFGAGPKPMDSQKSSPATGPVRSQAPRGVPTIIAWKTRNDGGITGKIYGSPNFDDGERVETSPIVSGSVQNGSVVTTGSGSRYFLSADTKITTANKVAAAATMKDIQAARPGATINLTRERKELDAKAAAGEVKPRATFSLFDLTGGSPPQRMNGPNKPTPPTSKAPRGVPSISKWRKNFDGSVTGNISGSPNFGEGEKITTSPIIEGIFSVGQVVKTGSGSRYFLA